ncbi:hypothetical protein FHS96_002432 [Sphingomonas zeicaulis]|uniref:beta-galactosidase n=1 Tax=Sphingomonas zeicaulis TaxID=1632740 RepID=UPI003D192CDC
MEQQHHAAGARPHRRPGWRSAAFLAALLATSPLAAQAPASIDATAPVPAPRSGHLHLGTGTGPGGTLGVNSRYLTRDGKPWIPVMGEFHASRFPAAYWEEEILKMKAAGVNIVATYILWNHYELAPGKLDWTGDRDIRRFAELCQKHGMMLFVRPGPWGHAEARFGGIPDWVVASTATRGNDPAYMAEVERFWRGLHDQLKGLMWKDGGPIVGFQVENEYNLVGAGQGRDHIAALKALAVKIGFDTPLYTVTGWDQTVYPRGEVVPVMGGYMDLPWAASPKQLPPNENYAFRFTSRVSGDLGAQTKGGRRGDADDDIENTPFLGAEYGGGLPVMYRRRPLMKPIDVSAAITTQIGSGVNLLGYYMFHGGANPLANGRTLEETQRSGGYNDVPSIGYDFQAPLGQYGEVNPVSGALRPLHYFLNAYGDRLAPTRLYQPAVVPKDHLDLQPLRWSLRGAGDAGFLFVNNHVRLYPTPAHRGVRFDVKLPGGTLTLPSAPVDIAPGANFIWPVNLDMDGVRLSWATAQPMTRLADDKGPIHVLAATAPGAVELAFDAATVAALSVPSTRDAGRRMIAKVMPKAAPVTVSVTGKDGKVVRILLLTQAQAGKAWVGDAFGQRRLVLTDADLFFAPDRMVLRQRGERQFRFAVWPALAGAKGSAPITRGRDGSLTATVPGGAVQTLKLTMERQPGEAPPITIGGPANAAMQPLPEAHRAAGAWSFTVPQDALAKANDAYLEIDYRGDVARLLDGTAMLDDAFWDGRVWRIGLKRFAPRLGRQWTMTVMPMRADAPIYLDDSARKQLPATGQVAEIKSVRLVPEHELVVTQ